MPAQLPEPVMPTWRCRPYYGKIENHDDDYTVAYTVSATSPQGEYPLLGGTKPPQVSTIQAATNTITLGVALLGKLPVSMLRVAGGNLPEDVKDKQLHNAHNKAVSMFQKLIPASDSAMYDFIAEEVEVHDALVNLHNLGCARAAAQLSNQPQEAAKLLHLIEDFVKMANYEIELVIDHLSSGKTNALYDFHSSHKKRQAGDVRYIEMDIARFRAIQSRIGVVPLSATVNFVMSSMTMYMFKTKEQRYAFWEERGDFISAFYAFARGPMNLAASFKKNPNFRQYAFEMFCSFCDNAYRMVIGIEKANQRLAIEWASVFMRSSKGSWIGPNKREQQARHHGFNTYYNTQMKLQGRPLEQITDINSLFVDKYTRNFNILKSGGNYRPGVWDMAPDESFDANREVAGYDG